MKQITLPIAVGTERFPRPFPNYGALTQWGAALAQAAERHRGEIGFENFAEAERRAYAKQAHAEVMAHFKKLL